MLRVQSQATSSYPRTLVTIHRSHLCFVKYPRYYEAYLLGMYPQAASFDTFRVCECHQVTSAYSGVSPGCFPWCIIVKEPQLLPFSFSVHVSNPPETVTTEDVGFALISIHLPDPWSFTSVARINYHLLSFRCCAQTDFGPWVWERRGWSTHRLSTGWAPHTSWASNSAAHYCLLKRMVSSFLDSNHPQHGRGSTDVFWTGCLNSMCLRAFH